ncbi:16834_t:CDS:2, partial [Cetraspora pellucida]
LHINVALNRICSHYPNEKELTIYSHDNVKKGLQLQDLGLFILASLGLCTDIYLAISPLGNACQYRPPR